jgi:hypothetical protein
MFLEQALNRALRVSSRATQLFFGIGERIPIERQLTFCEFELLLNVGSVLSFGCLLKARDVLLIGFNAGLQLLDAVNYGLCFRSGGGRMRSCIPFRKAIAKARSTSSSARRGAFAALTRSPATSAKAARLRAVSSGR